MPSKDDSGGVAAILADAANAIGGLSSSGAQEPQEELSLADIIQSLLATTSAEITSPTGFKYGKDELPPWFPQELIPVVASVGQRVGSVYDPYLGLLGQEGDERVFRKQTDQAVWVGDMGLWLGGGTDNGFSSQQDKVSRQLGEGRPKQQGTRKVDQSITTERAKNLPYLWSDEKVQTAMERMQEAGFPVKTFDQLTTVWDSLVDRASKMYSLSKGDRKVTPWDVLELSKQEAEKSGLLDDINGFTGTKVQTHKSVSEITEGQSWQALQSTLSQMLGRDPSDDELREYVYRMNSLAVRNPEISKTVARFKDGDMVSSTTHTDPGFTAADMAQQAYEDAQGNPEYGAYQAASLYFSAAQSALQAIGE